MGPYDGTFSNENAGTFVAMSSDGAIIAVGAPGFSSERGRVQVISTKPGVQWASLTDVPSVFQDGVDDIGSWSTLEGIPSGFADNVDNVDNMGNHTATMDLDMNRHDIRNVKSLVITGSQGVNNSGTGTQMYKQLEITYPEFNSFIFNDYKWFIGHQFATPSPVDDDLYFYVERGSTFDPAANVAGFVQDNENGPQMNFTGQHRCLVLDVDYNEAGLDARYSGLIVVAEHDEYLGMSAGLQKGHDAILINEALPIVALSSKQQDKRVFGVISHLEGPEREDAVGAFVTPFPKESGDQRFYINSVGEGGIWIIDEGGNLESGDYIQSSSVPGYGMRQKDQSMHNYTVAKITRACDFSPEEKPQQKIRRMAASEHDGSPAKNATDEFGRIIWETDYDINGETKVQSEYKVRYVKHDGTQITFDEYVQLKLEGVKVYRAAFIGCTYHCG